MPQLDVTSYLPQLVWLAISFVALYFLMAKLALPRIADVLEERSKRREDNLARAEELQAEAEAAAEAYERVLAEARGTAQSSPAETAQPQWKRAERSSSGGKRITQKPMAMSAITPQKWNMKAPRRCIS